jgi:tetratricopeptide (TPR) repeat protein
LSPEHLDTALEYFYQAAEKDPRCALAHVGIAYTWFSRGDCGLTPPSQAFAKAKASALKAVELDDLLAEVHGLLGNVNFIYDWDWPKAEAEFQKAIELNPNYADGHFFYADFLISVGRSEEARVEFDRAMALDPFNFFIHCFLGWHLLFLRRYDEAITQLRQTLRTQPNIPAVQQALWGAFHQKGMDEDAIEAAKEFFSLMGRSEIAEALTSCFAESGYREAMSVAAESLAARSKHTYVGAMRVARLHAHAGEVDRALDWLEKAYEEREPAMVHLSVGWDWDGLRPKRRFQDLIRQMNLIPTTTIR